MHGILASPLSCALSQNPQAGGSVRVDVCEGGKVCREVRISDQSNPERSVKFPERVKLCGGTGVSLCLNQGPGGSICRQIHSPCPGGGLGVRYRQMAL